MNRFAWTNAKSISEAAAAASTTVADAMTLSPEAMDHGDTAIVKANGIDILDLLKEGLLKPANVVSLTGVPGLDEVVEDKDGGLRIGPMATLASLSEHRILQQRYPALADALRGSASPQIRNMATLGGNLLNARVAGTSGQTRFIVCARVAAIASRSTAKINITRFSTIRSALSSILRPRPRCWWRWARQSSLPMERASGVAACSRISSCRSTAMCSARMMYSRRKF